MSAFKFTLLKILITQHSMSTLLVMLHFRSSDFIHLIAESLYFQTNFYFSHPQGVEIHWPDPTFWVRPSTLLGAFPLTALPTQSHLASPPEVWNYWGVQLGPGAWSLSVHNW